MLVTRGEQDLHTSENATESQLPCLSLPHFLRLSEMHLLSHLHFQSDFLSREPLALVADVLPSQTSTIKYNFH